MDSVPPAPDPERLKLRAVDTDDLNVIAAFLQDSIANVSEMAYLPNERRFALVVCRFRWEQVLRAEPQNAFERISCAITIDAVDQPKYRGFSLKDRGRTMPLLTILFDEGAVVLSFGGGAAIRLGVERLDLRMEDFGPCWPTDQVPEHESPQS